MIAIIGYGSLIWDLDDLTGKVHGDWQLGAGPQMPVEFCRVSPKRKQALVLALDPELPIVRTSVISSRRTRLGKAIEDLAARERTNAGMIGYAERNGRLVSRHETIGYDVMAWLHESAYDAAIWTDLDVNFSAKTGEQFGHDTALAYLQRLAPDQLDEAWRYITYAPVETDTPLRRFLNQQHWWQQLSIDSGKQTG